MKLDIFSVMSDRFQVLEQNEHYPYDETLAMLSINYTYKHPWMVKLDGGNASYHKDLLDLYPT